MQRNDVTATLCIASRTATSPQRRAKTSVSTRAADFAPDLWRQQKFFTTDDNKSERGKVRRTSQK